MPDLPASPSVDIGQLRLAAALVHTSPDVDLEVIGAGRRWIVSRTRPRATIDPCRFRQLVLATDRGCRVGLLPVETIRFTAGLRDVGGGVYDAAMPFGAARRIATFLHAGDVEILLHNISDAHSSVTGHVCGDEELGASVISITPTHPAADLRLDGIAQAIAASCMALEVITAVEQRTT